MAARERVALIEQQPLVVVPGSPGQDRGAEQRGTQLCQELTRLMTGS